MNIVLLGPPGSGKGTQAEQLSREYGLTHLSTGNVFREEISQGTALGKKVEQYVKSGRLVPDALVVEVVAGKLAEIQGSFLLDGFPRTLEQAQALAAQLRKAGKAIDAVVYINVRPDIVVARLGGRWTCVNCKSVFNQDTRKPAVEGKCDSCGGQLMQREDDKPEAIRKRLMVYEDLTKPLVAYYRSTENFHEVDGADAPEEVFSLIRRILSDGAKAGGA